MKYKIRIAIVVTQSIYISSDEEEKKKKKEEKQDVQSRTHVKIN